VTRVHTDATAAFALGPEALAWLEGCSHAGVAILADGTIELSGNHHLR